MESKHTKKVPIGFLFIISSLLIGMFFESVRSVLSTSFGLVLIVLLWVIGLAFILSGIMSWYRSDLRERVEDKMKEMESEKDNQDQS